MMLAVHQVVPSNQADFKTKLRKVSFWRASARVDESYLTSEAIDGTKVLVRFPCEDSDDYAVRRSITPTRNYIAGIIAKYRTAVFRHDPSRGDSPEVARLESDATGDGLPLNRFMEGVLESAQVDGIAMIAIASAAPSDEPLSAAQADAMGDASVLQLIRADSILEYETTSSGQLLWAMVLMSDMAGPFVRLFTAFDTQDARVRIEHGRATIVSLSEPVPHGLAGIPCALVEPIAGSSQLAPMAELQRSIVNRLSLLSAELSDNTFTRFVLSNVQLPRDEGGNVAPLQWGHKRIWTFEDQATLSRMGADVSQAASIRDAIADDEQALYRVAGVGASYVISGQQQSGVSRLVALEDFSVQCDALATAIERAENYILGLIHSAIGQEFTPTQYSRDFLESSYGEAVTRLRDALELLPPDDPRRAQMIDIFLAQHFTLGDQPGA
jgi:hypothetical protein